MLWEKYDCGEKSVQFVVVKFEISTQHQNGDVKKAIGHMSLELRKRSEDLNLGVCQHIGDT